MTRANDILGWFIVAVVVLSPIPLGSNAPIYWAISAFLIGLAATVYFSVAAINDARLRFPLSWLGLPGILWAILSVWLVAQMLPLGNWFGSVAFVTAAGETVHANALSLAPGSTWMMLTRMGSYGLLFLLTAQVGAREGRAKRMLATIFWAIVLYAAFGLFQLTQLDDTLLGFQKKYYQGYATGTFVNRNSYATFLSMGLALGAALLAGTALSDRQRNQSLGETASLVSAVLGGMVVMTIALLASQSRMGLLAAVVGLSVVTLLTLRWRRSSVWLFVIGLLGAALLGALAILSFGQGLLERIVYEGGNSSGRDQIYHQVLAMIATRPWLGFGGGAFELAFPMFYGAPMSPDVLIDKAHSSYLSLIAELGMVGALLPVASVGLVLWRIVARFVRVQSGAVVMLAAIGVVTVAATHSLVDFSLEMQANAYLFTAVLGLAQGQTMANSGEANRAGHGATDLA